MEIIKDIYKVQWNKTSVTLGKFDGVHLGHRMLMENVIAAKKNGCIPTVFTFDKFPSQFLRQEAVTSILIEEEKEQLLEKLGIERYVLFPFHEQTASMEPEEFVEEILVKTMKVQELFVGADFRFGKGRKGNVSMLEKLSEKYHFVFKAVDKRMYHGAEVSSSRIRDCIVNGEMEDANAMLGVPYYLTGEIVHGRSLGHTIGVPTINQMVPEGKILPKLGVYCARVIVNGKVYEGIANVGSKPTVQEEMIYGVETHLLNCNEDLYGKTAKTELLTFIRPEQKFSSIEELRQQLEIDKETATAYFGR
ncbi:MAG: bifunctional riboflavin kinase/FAD synthetase [Lachnospiraceae bacterium]|nr:bifunctional riboflavin kinase/FAD synthetase [Lachnospiraceae bacterium]